MSTEIIYNDGQPCRHVGCLNHVSHPCEFCKRIEANGIVYQNIDKSNSEDMTCKTTMVKLPDGRLQVINVEYE